MKAWFSPLVGVALSLSLSAAMPLAPAESGPTYTVPAASESVLAPDQRPRLPNVAFTDGRGAPRSLSSHRGKPVLLVVWATTCAPCVKQMPAIDALQGQLGPEGLEVIAMSQDPGGPAAVQRFLKQQGLRNLKVYNDMGGQAARMLGVRAMPTAILIDASGRQASRVEGPGAWNDPQVIQAIRTLLVEK